MFEKDYLMRMIQQFVRFIARVLFKIRNAQFEDARIDLSTAAQKYIGINFDLLLSMSNQAFLDMFSHDGQLDIQRCYIAACLLYLAGKSRDEEGISGSRLLFERSLDLLLRCFPEFDRANQADIGDQIDDLSDILSDHGLSADFLRRLINYQETRSRYSRAEDCLFQLIELDPRAAREEGEAFYNRLLSKSDDDLERGGLPREEIREGLRELRMKTTGG